MTYIIHGENKNGEDTITITGQTLSEIQSLAENEIKQRGWKNCWSEEISND